MPYGHATLKILHVISSLATRYGGPSQAVKGLSKAQAQRGHHVHVVTTNIDGNNVLGEATGSPIFRDGYFTTFHQVQFPRSYKMSFPLALDLNRRLKDFDIVHVHSLYLFPTLAAGYFASRYGVPFLVRPHGTLDPLHRSRHQFRKAVYDGLLQRRLLEKAAGIHFTTESERQYAEQMGLALRGFVAPLGVDLSEFEVPRKLIPARVAQLQDLELVTFVGRLSEKKSLHVLIEAFQLVAIQRKSAHLVIAGPDDEGLEENLRRLAKELGISAKVSFLGLIEGPEKVALLKLSKVFALPSLDENFGITVVEAMAASTPVVITEGVAIHREVSEGNGGIVAERNSEHFASAILAILSDESVGARLGSNARLIAERNFTWPNSARIMEAVYEEIRTLKEHR